MYPTTHIWSDATWNPVAGCSAVSTGCNSCYAAKLAATQQTAHRIPIYLGTTNWVRGKPVFNAKMTALEPGHESWVWPLTWPGARYPLLGTGKPSLIFVGDMCDLFHENRPTEIIDRVISTIAWSPHIGQLLTKRPERMAKYFTQEWSPTKLRQLQAHFWLGFSAERQKELDLRWPPMRDLADSDWTVFVSAAPLLGPIMLPQDLLVLGKRAWVICSGEQATKARFMQPAWARALRDQCLANGVAFFMRAMTGKDPIPRDLLIRQFPNVD
jgi:protein gp37